MEINNDVLERFDIGKFRDSYPSELSIGQQRMVEIARCLMTSPEVLLLDEPAAGLSPPNVDRLIDYIRAIRAEHGTTIVFVEHVMRVVTAVCDRVTVLDHGVLLATGLPEDVLKQEAVVAAYLGAGRA